MILGQNDHIFVQGLISKQRLLSHAYDPVKAHDYYERTKHLKGRKKGMSTETTHTPSSGGGSTSSNPPKQSSKKPQVDKEALRKEAEIRIAAYKVRLEKLKKVLALLVAEAKKRNTDNAGTKESRAKDAKSESSSTSKSDSKSSSSGSKSTSKEKEAAKKYYDKNKDKISLKKQEESLKKQITDVQKKIEDARSELKDSLKKAFDPKMVKTNKDAKQSKNTKQRNKPVVSQ